MVIIAVLFMIKKLEKNQVSFNRCMDKSIVVYSYNGILHSNEKEQMTTTCVNESHRHNIE